LPVEESLSLHETLLKEYKELRNAIDRSREKPMPTRLAPLRPPHRSVPAPAQPVPLVSRILHSVETQPSSTVISSNPASLSAEVIQDQVRNTVRQIEGRVQETLPGIEIPVWIKNHVTNRQITSLRSLAEDCARDDKIWLVKKERAGLEDIQKSMAIVEKEFRQSKRQVDICIYIYIYIYI
jgi:hypothetical protein